MRIKRRSLRRPAGKGDRRGVPSRLAILDAHQLSGRRARLRVCRIAERIERDASPQEPSTMAIADTTNPIAEDELLDNPFLLLFIGIALPTVLYIVWGVMEIVGIPIAK
jgi:hypothetical protein